MLRTIFLILALGCSTDVVSTVTSCEVQISTKDSTWVEVGQRFEIYGTPLTTHFDTAAYLGSQRANVLDVNRDSCVECDECRDREECNVCQDCDACDSICETSCESTLALEIPDVAPGEFQLQIYNSYGQSNALNLHVVHSPPDDTKTPIDTGNDSADPMKDTGFSEPQTSDSGIQSDTDTAEQSPTNEE